MLRVLRDPLTQQVAIKYYGLEQLRLLIEELEARQLTPRTGQRNTE